ncbi:hypothetical protein K6119_16955 [Paracrocinitomix mangrovi]|uniref:hypothetical protein n=1 Tax=Paracrocinitomix mangrovi TaxID=2862509 RepID=UPI001C8EF171|nr:hypothetical protein [Paracrocinitomix mangrovi]UKN01417.1 hypothetical protein K6119_16955 [Paracrocinitomix mangrovi]
METKRTYPIAMAIMFILLLASCTKTQTRTNKFMKQGRWQLTALSIGTNDITLLPSWDIGESNDSKAFSPAVWNHYDGSKSNFSWRFNYNGGTFTFQANEQPTGDNPPKANIQCNNLAGTYQVITEKKNLFEFESTETVGYPGVSVYIRMEPQ